MKLNLDKRSPSAMTEAEFNSYGEHLQRVQSEGSYRGAVGQPGAVSDAARIRAHKASAELSRIRYGLGHEAACQAEGI